MKRDALIEILKAEFDRKRSRNSAYSLRSFSRDLEIDASNLSKILSYQKAIGPALKEKLAKKIGLSDGELASLDEISNRTHDQSYKLHGLETFKIVSDWQHYAILELFKIKNFKPTPKNVASRLNISLAEAKESLLRLENANLLKRNSQGALEPTEDSSSSILTTTTSKAHRDQQKQILEGAIEALDQTPIELRSQSSVTLAIDTRKLEDARKLIKKFRRELGRLLSADTELDEVYQLSISLYPVSLNQEEK